MKLLAFLLLIIMSFQAHASGVSMSCWETGTEQRNDNIFYYINDQTLWHNFIYFDAVKRNVIDGEFNCINFDFPKSCQDKLMIDNNEVTVSLNTIHPGNSNFLQGYIYGVEVTQVYCKRLVK